MAAPANLLGQRFGRWTVVAQAGSRRGKLFWECVCDCGRPGARAEIQTSNLTSGHSTGCRGCPLLAERPEVYLEGEASEQVVVSLRGHLVRFDADDLPLFEAQRWHLEPDQAGFLRLVARPYSGPGRQGPRVVFGRLVAGALPRQIVRHLNGDSLDFRRANLRLDSPRKYFLVDAASGEVWERSDVFSLREAAAEMECSYQFVWRAIEQGFLAPMTPVPTSEAARRNVTDARRRFLRPPDMEVLGDLLETEWRSRKLLDADRYSDYQMERREYSRQVASERFVAESQQLLKRFADSGAANSGKEHKKHNEAPATPAASQKKEDPMDMTDITESNLLQGELVQAEQAEQAEITPAPASLTGSNWGLEHTLSPEAIREADIETLRRELASSLDLTAKALSYMAAIWKELERRGEDLSSLRRGMLAYVPKIAEGRLEAELVVKYASQRMLLNALAKTPLAQQRRLVEQGAVELVTIDEGGGRQVREVPLNRLAAPDIHFVFSTTGLRSVDEQFLMRSKRREAHKDAPPKTERPARKVEVDKARGRLIIGNRPISADLILPALSELYGFDVEAMVKRQMDTQKALGAFEGKQK